MDNLLQYCRYYKGEENCPPEIQAAEKSLLWDYEMFWVTSEEHRDENSANAREYRRDVLPQFNEDDGTPMTLKALLYNRYTHWAGGYALQDDIRNFKEWYHTFYLGERR